MTEEKITETKEKECKCFCRSEGLRNFLITALGTFVGVYCALSLFTAIHKPAMPCHRFMHPMAPIQMQGYKPHGDFGGMDKKFKKEFRGDIQNKDFQKPEKDD